MPTYDYLCERCDHSFEHFQSMTSRRLRKCPACGTPKLVRLVGSGAGLIFKGSGFYETDYRRAGGGSKPSDGSKSSGGSTAPEKESAPASSTSETTTSSSDKED